MPKSTLEIFLHKAIRKRYSLAELLRGTTPKIMKALNKKMHVMQVGKAIGREIV